MLWERLTSHAAVESQPRSPRYFPRKKAAIGRLFPFAYSAMEGDRG
jgi:hypothetical protein